MLSCEGIIDGAFIAVFLATGTGHRLISPNVAF